VGELVGGGALPSAQRSTKGRSSSKGEGDFQTERDDITYRERGGVLIVGSQIWNQKGTLGTRENTMKTHTQPKSMLT